jgi:hypothetical protein
MMGDTINLEALCAGMAAAKLELGYGFEGEDMGSQDTVFARVDLSVLQNVLLQYVHITSYF